LCAALALRRQICRLNLLHPRGINGKSLREIDEWIIWRR
jgi:hypothetical protein